MNNQIRLLQIGFLILAAAVIFLSYIIVQQQETINVINDFFYFLNEIMNESISI